jgi:hypothetical protein
MLFAQTLISKNYILVLVWCRKWLKKETFCEIKHTMEIRSRIYVFGNNTRNYDHISFVLLINSTQPKNHDLLNRWKNHSWVKGTLIFLSFSVRIFKLGKIFLWRYVSCHIILFRDANSYYESCEICHISALLL